MSFTGQPVTRRSNQLATRLGVRALAVRYGLPYNTGSLTRQFGTTVWKIVRYSFPGGSDMIPVGLTPGPGRP